MMKEINTSLNRLALTYLSIIMVLSVGFSIIFYHESSRAVGSGLRSQTTQLRNNIFFAQPDVLERIRRQGVEDFNKDLLFRLIVLNIGMLVAGGFLSAVLAKKSLEPMEEALAAQSRFTSDAAHELRTPLTAMRTEIEVVLRSKTLDKKELQNTLSSSLEEINKLETLTAALLRLAKNAHQPNPSTWTKNKIIDVIQPALDRVGAQAKKKKITFQIDIASKKSIRGDKDQLIELFVILLDNAIKYGTENTVVTLTASDTSDSIKINVADKGIGISEQDLPHIFERFYRADLSRTKNSTSGYGLGLSVAEAIVKSHNGHIEVTSVPNVGSTFSVNFLH